MIMTNFGYEVAIFDLDGTIFNSTYIWKEIDEEFLGERGFEVPEDYCEKVSHCSLQEAAIYTINSFNLNEDIQDIINRWNEMARMKYAKDVQLKEDAKNYLLKLKAQGVKLAVATGLPHNIFEETLKRLEIIDLFDVLCSVDDVKKGKSKPDIYLYTADKLSVNPENCVVYEDIYDAMISVKNANMKVCAVWDDNHVNEEKIHNVCDYYINSWTELL